MTDVMADLEKRTGKEAGHYHRRMEEIVEEQQAKSGRARSANPGEVNEEGLRHAIKEELRKDVLAYLDTLSPEEAAREFQRLAKKLNGSDLGNLGEDWYRARFAQGGEAHARASKEALAGGRPPIHIETDRYIDTLLPNGTAVEIKSIAGKLSDREAKQLKDTLAMLKDEAQIGDAATPVTHVKYVFTRPQGLKSNLIEIERLLKQFPDDFSCEVFLANGKQKLITSTVDLEEVVALL